MSTQVIMPQLGESVVEGTIGKWLIAEGQPVKEYEPLVQITTDKVDTEIPAPASGILLKVYVPEGKTVAKGTLLAKSKRYQVLRYWVLHVPLMPIGADCRTKTT